MNASGTFDVELRPQADTDCQAGRALIDKSYYGVLSGTGKGQMLSKRTAGGDSVYYAIEEFSGSIDGKTGGFTFVHVGKMTQQAEWLDIEILAGSGHGELKNISGSLAITQDSGNHKYELLYRL